MAWDVISKTQRSGSVSPMLGDYEETRDRFSWTEARTLVDGFPDGRLNVAHEAVARHAAGPRASRTALRCLARDRPPIDISYARLHELTSRFANALRALGIERGERVFVLAERVPELYVAALGTVKAGCVFCPLFAAFGPEPIRTRIALGGGALLVTTPTLYRRKIHPIHADLQMLRHVVLIDDGSDAGELLHYSGVHGFTGLIHDNSDDFVTVATRSEDMALLHFTSGTTGRPKGVVHVHEAVVAHAVTARYALDLHEDDVYWCTADPGWVTGTSYGIIAPLVLGVTMIVDREEMDARRWYRILQDEKVTVWYTAPTAIRMLMKVGAEVAQGFDFSHLRHLCSVGEPLNPDAVVWGQQTFGIPFHDNWWQTETGAIMIANFPSMDVRPGSMGKPLPGIEAGVVRREADGRIHEIAEPEIQGELALRPGWPSMFRAYLNDDERYRKCFADGWYLTGDLARRDADGYYWFVGRADDVIKSAGHLIGPFEVESALMEHEAVAGAGVIGKPDAVAGEIVKAFVELRPGHEGDETMRRTLLGFARTRLGPAVAPKEIAFVEHLPRTRSGKIMRRLLKARELGLPEGDTSTLESGT